MIDNKAFKENALESIVSTVLSVSCLTIWPTHPTHTHIIIDAPTQTHTQHTHTIDFLPSLTIHSLTHEHRYLFWVTLCNSSHDIGTIGKSRLKMPHSGQKANLIVPPLSIAAARLCSFFYGRLSVKEHNSIQTTTTTKKTRSFFFSSFLHHDRGPFPLYINKRPPTAPGRQSKYSTNEKRVDLLSLLLLWLA